MQVIFESRDAKGNELRDMMVERVRFALRRLSAWVPRAKVQLSDVNGPRGGVDKYCKVEILTDTAGKVVIASTASDWRSALDRTLRRALSALKRSLQRTKKPARRRVAQLALDN